jgi:sodium-dependent dicarboxylate transporter 2/3/5
MRFLRLLIPLFVFAGVALALRGFGHQQAMVGAVFATTVALWIGQTLPLAMTALLSTAALVLLAGVKEKVAFSAYGDPIIPLFIGSFILAKAMEVTGLSERVAHAILAQEWASRTPTRLLFSLNSVACALSLLVSNTAITAMLLPVGLAILRAIGRDRVESYAIGLLLCLTWGSSIAVGFPVGTPPNLIGISMIDEATGTRLSFVQWMGFAMPITVLVLLASTLLLVGMYGRRNPPETSHAAEFSRVRLRELGPMKASERIVTLAFGVALSLWVLPDSAELILGKTPLTAWLQSHVTAAVASLVAAALLFVAPTSDRSSHHAIDWGEAARIDWGTILLFGGGIAVGQAMFSSGLAKELGELAAQAAGADSLWKITALSILSAIVLSELASNTAAATTLIPVAIGLAQGAEVNPIPPALGAAIGASFGFMLPVSTAPNAIVYSSGLIPSREMLRAGILLDLIGFAAIFVGLRLILPLMGLA